MSWTRLPENYTDAVWDGLKKYNQIDNPDGTVSFQDVTIYTQKENSFFGARDANKMNQALNIIMSMVENGTDLYAAFSEYFETQKTLFSARADSEYDDYVGLLNTKYTSFSNLVDTDYSSFTQKADTSYESFQKYLTDMETEGFTSLTAIANRAETSAQNAKTSETNAKASETNAAGSASAAQTSETNANTAKESAETAKGAAENAQASAETASANARQSAQTASDILAQNREVAVRTPYIGTNGNWFVWNNSTTTYEDSGVQAQGEQGIQGIQGERGEKGDQGVNGVALAADGIFAFNVDENGHLILSYTGTEAPNFSINDEGHLICNI